MSTETWTYMGRRQVAGGGLGYLWMDESGAEHFFKKLPGGVIGGAYEVQAERTEESITVRGGARWVARDERHERAGEWDARDRAASTAETMRKQEAKAKREDRPMRDLTVEEVADLYWRLPAPQQGALLARLILAVQQKRAS